MSSLRNLFLGPASSVGCRSCGKPVSIHWRHFLGFAIPVVAVLGGMRLLDFQPLAILLASIPFLFAVCLVQLRFLPPWPDRTLP